MIIDHTLTWAICIFFLKEKEKGKYLKVSSSFCFQGTFYFNILVGLYNGPKLSGEKPKMNNCIKPRRTIPCK